MLVQVLEILGDKLSAFTVRWESGVQRHWQQARISRRFVKSSNRLGHLKMEQHE